MKLRELRALENVDLVAHMKELAGQLNELNFQKRVAPLENPLRMRNLRREIARIKTIIQEREMTEKV